MRPRHNGRAINIAETGVCVMGNERIGNVNIVEVYKLCNSANCHHRTSASGRVVSTIHQQVISQVLSP